MIFDTHAHYDDERFDADRDALLTQLPELGVGLVVNIGCSVDRSIASAKLADKYPHIYATVGVHPHDAGDMDDNDLHTLEALCEKAVAVGEIGLDYHYDYSPRDVQKKRFRQQMELARAFKLPVVIHDRQAHEDCMKIIKEFPDVRGVFHCYSGSLEMAMELIKMGWHISFTGNVTFKNAAKLAGVAAWVPDERLMIETDCPYMAPEPHRGKRNDSSMLKHLINRLAGLRGTDPEYIETLTWENGKRFFGIT